MIIRDKKFYTTFFKLASVMALYNLLAYGANLSDNIMLGRYSEVSLAATAMINQIHYLLQMISIAGIGAGAVVLVSQYWGKGDVEAIRRIIALALKIAALTGFVFFIVSFCFPDSIAGIFTKDDAIRAEAVKYLRVMCFTFLIFPLEGVLIASLRGARIVLIGTIVSVVGLVTDTILNYMFIFGNWGAPEWGILGAAATTVMSRVIELTIVLIYVRFVDKKLKLRILDFIKPDAYYLSDFIKVALPVMLSGLSWGIGSMLQIVILGHMSQSVVAANSIAATIYQVMTSFSFGLASTSSVMIGNIIGEGRMDQIRPYSQTLQLLYIASGLVTGLVLFLLRGLILQIYILEPATRDLSYSFMTLLSLFVVFAAYQYPAASGIVLGGGNTRYPVIVETLFIWLCVLPLSALSAFVWKLPPIITFICLKSDQFLKCIPNGIVVNRYRWVRVLTRD